MSTRPNPFEQLEQVFDRISRQVSDAAQDWETGSALELPLGGASVPVDFVDADDEFVITADLPGFDPNDIDVRVSDNVLSIRGTRTESTEDRDDRYLRKERRSEAVERSIRLPAPVDTDAVAASLDHGVLTVTVPKAEPRTEATPVEISE